jgi:hypothetical protein
VAVHGVSEEQESSEEKRMTRIAVVIGSLMASTAAYAVDKLQKTATPDDQTGYWPFPWEDES